MKLAHLLSPDQLKPWAKRLVDDLNRDRSGIGDLPTFADDAAAAAAGIPLKGGYVTPAGIVRRRVA